MQAAHISTSLYIVIVKVSASGGQLLGCNGKLFEKIDQLSIRFALSVKLKKRASQLTFCITSMYGPNDRSMKPLFLQDLHVIHAWCSVTPWALMGDFDMTRFTEERRGCIANLNDSDSFNDLIRDLALIDIPLGEGHLLGHIRETPRFCKAGSVPCFRSLGWYLPPHLLQGTPQYTLRSHTYLPT